MTGARRDPVDASCVEWDVELDVKVFQDLGSTRKVSGRCHGQQGIPCVPLHLLRRPKMSISPCTLHVSLGLVLALDDSMTSKVGQTTLEAAW